MQHKELMKQLKTNVDVLTLTATPIPRTLEMSLVGIRDLSLLQTPAGRPPADPHVRRRLRRAGRRRGDPPRAAARGPGLLGPQPGALDRARRRPAARAGARGAHRRRPRADGRGHAGAGRRRLLGRQVRRARVHDDHRVRHRHADRQHARRRALGPARPRPAAPAARAASVAAGSGPTPTSSTPSTSC